MDSLFMQPFMVVALAAAIIVTAYEMRAALEPARCPECPHCLAAAREREAQQRNLQEQYARRNGLDGGDDDDRMIG
jgi:hypothetical protein